MIEIGFFCRDNFFSTVDDKTHIIIKPLQLGVIIICIYNIII